MSPMPKKLQLHFRGVSFFHVLSGGSQPAARVCECGELLGPSNRIPKKIVTEDRKKVLSEGEFESPTLRGPITTDCLMSGACDNQLHHPDFFFCCQDFLRLDNERKVQFLR